MFKMLILQESNCLRTNEHPFKILERRVKNTRTNLLEISYKKLKKTKISLGWISLRFVMFSRKWSLL